MSAFWGVYCGERYNFWRAHVSVQNVKILLSGPHSCPEEWSTSCKSFPRELKHFYAAFFLTSRFSRRFVCFQTKSDNRWKNWPQRRSKWGGSPTLVRPVFSGGFAASRLSRCPSADRPFFFRSLWFESSPRAQLVDLRIAWGGSPYPEDRWSGSTWVSFYLDRKFYHAQQDTNTF